MRLVKFLASCNSLLDHREGTLEVLVLSKLLGSITLPKHPHAHLPQLEFLNLPTRRLGIRIDPENVFRNCIAQVSISLIRNNAERT
jgi:hypothetical protein